MKTDIEIKDILYPILKDSILGMEITGAVYKDSRPTNSDKEDILISVLDSINGLYQKTVVNVNIYTQDLKRGTDSIENADRIRYLSRLACDLLHAKVCNDYLIEVEKQPVLAIGTTEHVINTKLLLTLINF